ncbi:transglutaminase-like domain-containing protein [Xylanimonas ulmi]|uniref:Transglutaminase superfamily protein n=1 Tax=Xylanimonas ulmi TaxID=228973 RepID=A0A4Q7M8R0_9MICO|nr:transglutaminase-like domain-containing protein [Xylanibacterium ulmi]RZS63098.1 transglutaminase superfamily protein [Xylanibacterium ulmi]
MSAPEAERPTSTRTRAARGVRGVWGTTTRGRAARRTGDAPATGPAERPRALRLAGLVDGAVLLALLGAVAVGFGPVWGSTGYLRPALGGAVLGLAVAWLAAAQRWSALTTAAAVVVAYLLAGGALALPATTAAGAVPTPETLGGLALGAAHGWKEFVTTAPPLHSFPGLAVVPLLVLYLAGVLAGVVAWRARVAAWALVPVAAALVSTILLGSVEAAFPVPQGLVIGVVGLLWGALRVIEGRVGRHTVTTEASREATRRLRWYRFRTGAAILGVGAVAAAFAAPAIAPAQPRTVLREMIVPPLDLHEFVSPLTSFRKYAKDERETELLTITGLPAGQRVRLATLDTYDGVVFDASSDQPGSGTYTRAGDEITTADPAPRTRLDVQVLDYTGPWIPDAGSLTGITWTGARARALADGSYYDSVTHTAITTQGLASGDTYRLDAQLAPQPTEGDLRASTIEMDTPLPTLDASLVPESAAAKAAQFMGEETDPVKRLFALRDGLVASGVYSSGLEDQAPSRSGHSAARIDVLLAGDEMIGDDEQFAVALALMAREAGIPARVSMGFYADPKQDTRQDGEPYTVVGGDVHAWAEVPFAGYGWVAIDAVPDEDNKIQPEPQSEQVPKPPVLQEPEPPEEPADDVPGDVREDRQEERVEAFDWAWLGLVAVSVGVPLLVILVPLLLILALKRRRRTHRRRAERPSDRVSGGWREVLDVATDLGVAVPRRGTRRESAHALADALAAPATLGLAYRADATVFAAGEPTDVEVDAYWADVDAYVDGLRTRLGRRRRLRAAVSLRSLRGEAGWAALRGMLRRPPTVAPRATRPTAPLASPTTSLDPDGERS